MLSKSFGNCAALGLNTALETISARETNLISIDDVMLFERTTYTTEPNVIRLAVRRVVYQMVNLARIGRDMFKLP